MDNCLTENATFTCDKGGIIKCKDTGNDTVKYKGATVLTIGATVSSKSGICAILTAMSQGTPQPCKCQLTAWMPFSPNKFSNGKNLLTKASKNACPYGGIISAQPI